MNKTLMNSFIAGKEIETKERVSLFNPAKNKEKVGEISTCSVSHVEIAVTEAEKAWQKWSQLSAEKRANYLIEIANYIEGDLDVFSNLLVLESGRLLMESRRDLIAAIEALRYYSGITDELKDKIVENNQGTMILTRQSVGVVSVIVPWNSPITLTFLMLAPSLLAGNTVVIKPPTYAPLTITKILNHLARELPKGVLNVVLGSGSTVGKRMVEHQRVRKVAFTGSTDTGRDIMASASRNIKKLSMELGGNDAAVILKDMPIDAYLINECINSVFTACGQICYSMKRIYVHKDHYETFVNKFTDAANEIIVGYGLDSEITMGAINNKSQYDEINKLIEKTKKSNAVVKEVGKLSDKVSMTEGYFVLPTIVTNVKNSDPIVQEEQFGPVIPIIPFDTEEEAINMANDTEFGLGNSIWTTNTEYGFKLARKLQSGSVFINTHKLGSSAINMPFGGFKQSGIGRGHGVESLMEHTELQALIHRIDM